MSTKIKQEVEDFIRDKLSERLSKLTDEQRLFFKKIFPGKVPYDKLYTAIDLCDRTIAKNLKGRKNPNNSSSDKMIFLKGEEKSFRCDCGCNVFKEIGDLKKFICNSCQASYTGE